MIENKPGAGNNIGTEQVIRAAPDGYTILLVNPANAINATLYVKINFNFLRDIAPVAGIARVPNIMTVNPNDAGQGPLRSSSPTPRPIRQDQHGVVRETARPSTCRASFSCR